MCHNYIVVRADLDAPQQVLQGIHAALICRAVPDEDALVFLTTKDEQELVSLADSLESELQPYRYFEDEHLNSVAFRAVSQEQRKAFRKLEKWKN